MKNITKILALVIAIAGGSFQAQANWTEETCNALSGMAGSIMALRQRDTTMAEALTIVRGVEGSENYEPSLTRIIVMAYKEPAFNGQEAKDRSVRRFSDMFLVECYSTLQD